MVATHCASPSIHNRRVARSCAVRKENSSKGCGEMKANLEPVRAGGPTLRKQCYDGGARA
jgi:hypothetical protein